MKYLLVLAVLLVAYYLWRHNREVERQERVKPQPPPANATPAQLDAMVTCRHCGLHLPASEAQRGALGYYCGPEHKRFAEG
jgi:uncharacterized protein